MSLTIRLQPKQSELWQLWDKGQCTRVGFGGARGGSKSGGGRRCMLARRLQYPHTTGLILRRTYPELYKSHITKLFEEYPGLRQYWREASKELLFDNGSRLFFGSAEHEKDMSSYYSAEFADILVDEAQEFSQYELEQLGAANRCTSNEDITPKTVYTFMPGFSEAGLPPKGLNYLTRVFVNGQLQGEERESKWAFIQAFAWDNFEWARKEFKRDGLTEEDFYSWPEEQRRNYFINRTEFGEKLRSLSNKALRDAWLYGKWDVFQGMYFPNFDPKIGGRHVVDPESIKLQPWYKRWCSMDWGFDHPACVHLHCKLEDGRIYTYKESWGREIGETAWGVKIGELCEGQKIQDFVMSWDAFGKLNPTTRKSITDMVGEALPKGIPKPTPGDATPGSRIAGWRNMYNLLDSGGWIISRDCPKLIECLPTLVRDMQRAPEDVLKVDHSENYIGDDAADCARMGLQHELQVAGVPVEVKIQQRIKEMGLIDPDPTKPPNYTQINIWHQKLQAKQRHDGKPIRFGRHHRDRHRPGY